MLFENLPAVDSYQDWKDWARAVSRVLAAHTGGVTADIDPSYVAGAPVGFSRVLVQNTTGAIFTEQADPAVTPTAAALKPITDAIKEQARLTSYPNPGSVLSAADVGASVTITIAGHVRVYPVQGDVDIPDVTVTGGTLTGLSFSTRYYVYYDDVTLALVNPVFLVTTISATSQVGAAVGRHFLGFIDTPADGAGDTSGAGGGPPGAGGGGGAGGTYIP